MLFKLKIFFWDYFLIQKSFMKITRRLTYFIKYPHCSWQCCLMLLAITRVLKKRLKASMNMYEQRYLIFHSSPIVLSLSFNVSSIIKMCVMHIHNSHINRYDAFQISTSSSSSSSSYSLQPIALLQTFFSDFFSLRERFFFFTHFV